MGGYAMPQVHLDQAAQKSNTGDRIEDYDDPLDCPCVQEIKKGPCGDAFVVAFTCFIESQEETKGMDCVEQFLAMQECFTANPEVYGQYLSAFEGDDEEEEEEEQERKVSPASPAENSTAAPAPSSGFGQSS